MLKSSLSDYRHAYILLKGIIKITEGGVDDAAKLLEERNKGVIFKNCAQFTDICTTFKFIFQINCN